MSLGVVVDDVTHEFTQRSGGGTSVRRVLDGVSLHATPGRSMALRGPSGSGKTTLLNLIGGLDLPTAGRITIDGVDLTSMGSTPRDHWRRSTVAFVFQQSRLIATLSARENIELAIRVVHGPRSDARTRADAALEMVEISDLGDSRPAELSGGQAQRVNIARAVATNAPLILADEPTSSLDAATASRMVARLQSVTQERGCTLIVATHDPVVVAGLDESVVLIDGLVQPADE